jgi:predicted ATPase
MFIVQRYKRNRKPPFNLGDKDGPVFLLTENNWNDWGYETTFWIDAITESEYIELGSIQILHRNETKTREIIPREFEKLKSSFISLGMDEGYYEKVIDLFGPEEAKSIFRKLNDISIFGLDDNRYFDIDHLGIQTSFFRSSNRRYMYHENNNKFFLDQETKDRDYKFSFYAELGPYPFQNIEIEIDFKKHGGLPNRLFTIIGKNGVGKTRLLNQIAESLYDSSKKANRNRFLLHDEHPFDNNIPIYQKIIAISFSVFDNFYKGKIDKSQSELLNVSDENKTKERNYTYIGLHKNDDTMYSKDELIQINKRAYKNILKKNRALIFIEAINKSNIIAKEIDIYFDVDDFFEDNYSSGQSIFISMLCRLISEIEEGSLIFLDEPELYLHPNAIATLAKLYYEILYEFKSYAILCTHSPVLLQEIPSRYVRKLFSVDSDIINYTKSNIETFGTNISDIVADIFNVLDSESLYRSKLIQWSKELSSDEIMELFDNNLSFKTELFINNLYKERD